MENIIFLWKTYSVTRLDFNLTFSYFLSVEFIKFFQGGDQVFHSDNKLDNSEYVVHGDQDKNYSKASFALTNMRFY